MAVQVKGYVKCHSRAVRDNFPEDNIITIKGTFNYITKEYTKIYMLIDKTSHLQIYFYSTTFLFVCFIDFY